MGRHKNAFLTLHLHFWSMDAACMAFFKILLPLDMGSHENVSVGFISMSGAGMLLHKELTTVEDSPHITVQHVSFRCSGGDSVL